MSLKEKAKINTVPAFFIASKQDNFVKYHHSEKLMKHYKGKKELFVISGDHHSCRSLDIIKKYVDYFKGYLLE